MPHLYIINISMFLHTLLFMLLVTFPYTLLLRVGHLGLSILPYMDTFNLSFSKNCSQPSLHTTCSRPHTHANTSHATSHNSLFGNVKQQPSWTLHHHMTASRHLTFESSSSSSSSPSPSYIYKTTRRHYGNHTHPLSLPHQSLRHQCF